VGVIDRYGGPSAPINFHYTYRYDSFDRRVYESHYINGTGSVFFYDGEDVAFTIGQGSAGRYLHGPAVDEILARDELGTTIREWVYADHLGSVRDIVNQGNFLTHHMDYNAFGGLLGGSNAWYYGFTGREYDHNTGLNYHRARWLDSWIGRWINEDPTGFAGGDINLNRYVDNEVSRAVDPRGLEKVTPKRVAGSREEMDKAKLSDAEIRLRLKILENAYFGKVGFPNSSKSEHRNPEFWQLRGSYVPIGDPVAAINDLWQYDKSKIQCNKYSKLIIIKSYIDLADASGRKKITDALRGKIIPNDLPRGGRGLIFDYAGSEDFQPTDLLPGDQIWFQNPYWRRLTDAQKEDDRYLGEQGSNIFYFGNGYVLPIYGGQEIYTIDQYRRRIISAFNCVTDLNPNARPEEFKIRSRYRPLVNPF
jgi:RHS repeat-associated protein